MNEKISVIVPIYNVEKYLRECIDSIVNQTYKNLEIILVNDGSPDNCGQICDEYAKKDNRIKVIHKENSGLSDARNSGLKIATGNFISFIDSDDWLNCQFYETMMKNIEFYDADIATSNFNFAYYNLNKLKYMEKQIRVFNTNEAMAELIVDGLVQAIVWNKLYKRELLQGEQFKKGKLNEDEFFTYKIVAKANRVVYIPEGMIFYRQRENSIMSTYTMKRLDAIEALYERMNFIKLNFPELLFLEKKIFLNICIFNYQMILGSKDKSLGRREKNNIKQYHKQIKFGKNDLKHYNESDIIWILLSKLSLELCCRLRNYLKIGF